MASPKETMKAWKYSPNETTSSKENYEAYKKAGGTGSYSDIGTGKKNFESDSEYAARQERIKIPEKKNLYGVKQEVPHPLDRIKGSVKTEGPRQEAPHPAGPNSTAAPTIKKTVNSAPRAPHPAGEGSTKIPPKLGIAGGAASVLSTAKDIDSILKGKKDVLKETGIRKTPEEL